MNTDSIREKDPNAHTTAKDEPAPFVSNIFGDGEQAYRLAWIGGWLLKVPMYRFDFEPRVCDSHLADCLGLDSPNALREMILCFIAEEMPMGQHAEIVLRRWGAEFDAVGEVEFWLAETQAIDVLYRSELTLDSALFSELLDAFATARAMRTSGSLDRSKLPANAADLGPMSKQTQAMLAKSVSRKKAWAKHRQLLENPETLAQLYGMLAMRIERESWYPILRTPS